MDPINFIIYFLILAAIVGIAYWAFSQINLPPPIRTGFIVVAAIVVIIILAGFLTGSWRIPPLIR